MTSPVSADGETPTPTATVVIEGWWKTSTPIVPGSCPDDPVSPDLDLSSRYKQYCSQCIMTGTPAFPTTTKTPAPTSTGTITPIPTNTATPTTTPVPALGSMTVKSSYDRLASPVVWTGRDERVYWNYHRTDKYSLNDQVQFFSSTGAVPHVIGIQFYGDETVPSYYGYNIKHAYWIRAGTGSTLKVHFYTGIRAGQDVTITGGSSLETVIYSVNPSSGNYYASWSETFDVTIQTNGSSAYDFVVDNVKTVYNYGNLIQDFNYQWVDGGYFYFPPQDGLCRVPEIRKSEDGDLEDWFMLGMYPFWIGNGSCVDLNFMVNWLNSQAVQDVLEFLTGGPININVQIPSICFRQFSMAPLKFFGITIDYMVTLYAVVGIWVIKNLLQLTH